MDGFQAENETVKNALSNVEAAQEQIRNADSGAVLGDGDVVSSFAGLPIESLICGPIIAAAKGQQELTAVYVDGLMKLAYKDGQSGGETNTLDFNLDRPVQNNDGTVATQQVKISAPLLSLVPVPAFMMDELTVDFNMEVKNSDLSSTETKADVSTTLSYKSWFGLSTQITGNVSSDSSHKRETDSSATYQIHARAIQQPPSEGMAKLTALFAQAMEPIPAKEISGK